MKLVVDINVLVSGSLWRGNSSRLVDALLDGVATLCVSPAILAEFEEVIQRDKFRKRIEERNRNAKEIVSLIRAAALIVEGRAIPIPSTLRDPDDVHVLSCAVDAAADAIITGDNDLLTMETFEGIPILTARQALEKLGISPD
ncbi:MAG TPA: putative toxin-antitoxin system toxin component, PIN family [Verrucomicrobiae bacterium]